MLLITPSPLSGRLVICVSLLVLILKRAGRDVDFPLLSVDSPERQ